MNVWVCERMGVVLGYVGVWAHGCVWLRGWCGRVRGCVAACVCAYVCVCVGVCPEC